MTSKILKILFEFGGNRTARSSSALEKLDGARVGQREPVTGRGTSFDCLRKDKIKGPRASFSHRRKSPWNASLARGHFIGLRYGDFIDRGAEDVESTYYLHAASPLSLSLSLGDVANIFYNTTRSIRDDSREIPSLAVTSHCGVAYVPPLPVGWGL